MGEQSGNYIACESRAIGVAFANPCCGEGFKLAIPVVQAVYPVELRRVTARVEVEGELREMVFLTNNVTWSAQTIADRYRCRWSIEVFFKELKQTLQPADFLGHSALGFKSPVDFETNLN